MHGIFSQQGCSVDGAFPMMIHSADSDAKMSDTPCLMHPSLSPCAPCFGTCHPDNHTLCKTVKVGKLLDMGLQAFVVAWRSWEGRCVLYHVIHTITTVSDTHVHSSLHVQHLLTSVATTQSSLCRRSPHPPSITCL